MNVFFKLLFSNYLYIAKRLGLEKAKKICPLLRGNILDIGCGDKPYKNFFNKDNRYFGMERYECVFIPDIFGDAKSLPFQDETFAAVLFNEVIEHLVEPDRGLKEIWRVLKKGGKLFMTAPMYWRLHYAPDDYLRFTNYGLKYLLEKNGFFVQEIERLGGFFSIVFVRLIDIFVTKVFFKVTDTCRIKRGKYRLAALLTWPFSLTGYYLARLLDNLDKDDAFLWVALAIKK